MEHSRTIFLMNQGFALVHAPEWLKESLEKKSFHSVPDGTDGKVRDGLGNNGGWFLATLGQFLDPIGDIKIEFLDVDHTVVIIVSLTPHALDQGLGKGTMTPGGILKTGRGSRRRGHDHLARTLRRDRLDRCGDVRTNTALLVTEDVTAVTGVRE